MEVKEGGGVEGWRRQIVCLESQGHKGLWRYITECRTAHLGKCAADYNSTGHQTRFA